MRQLVLDTETTGLDVAAGHRLIEIGIVELVNRELTGNTFHCYLQPDRKIDDDAVKVHHLTNQFLADKPRFADVAAELLNYLQDSPLIIHNAAFDLGFLNSELRRWRSSTTQLESQHTIIDTLILARGRHPGQQNTLDALCKRYSIANDLRDARQQQGHGALLDARLLAELYLLMTGGQVSLYLDATPASNNATTTTNTVTALSVKDRPPLRIVFANETELTAHERGLERIDKASKQATVWRRLVE
ncbi:DNA polymerase III subunit epsilon [Thiospirillum jenense]|uniref:DNA polymerase III subunit epsilon n=1 Tax=Thiospirillum jenense TaxID=1653858 RepID=A0A839HH63_9GAMM|nr:DNA polymerase III subunit epsilon [Thiospirillum jenense]MBB1126408.1 DNA polymerase III subunit epsilon [Thiospirillum jenense]